MTTSRSVFAESASEHPSSPENVSIPLCTPEQVSQLTGLSLETLAQWRSRKKGISYLKIGRRVRYDKREVLQYLEQCRVSVRKGQKQ